MLKFSVPLARVVLIDRSALIDEICKWAMARAVRLNIYILPFIILEVVTIVRMMAGGHA
jgi:hypothetical protein